MIDFPEPEQQVEMPLPPQPLPLQQLLLAQQQQQGQETMLFPNTTSTAFSAASNSNPNFHFNRNALDAIHCSHSSLASAPTVIHQSHSSLASVHSNPQPRRFSGPNWKDPFAAVPQTPVVSLLSDPCCGLETLRSASSIFCQASSPLAQLQARFSHVQKGLFSQQQQPQQQCPTLVPGLYSSSSSSSSSLPSLMNGANAANAMMRPSRKRRLQECSDFQLQQRRRHSIGHCVVPNMAAESATGVWGMGSLHPLPTLTSSTTTTITPPTPILLATPSPHPNTAWKKANQHEQHHHSKRPSSTTIASIPRAIRRRIRSMTRGTKLVPKQLPPLMIVPKGDNDEDSNNSDPNEELPTKESTTPVVSLLLPSNTRCVYNESSTEAAPNDSQQEQQKHQQVFLRTHTLLGQGAFATVASVTLEESWKAAASSSSKSSETRTDNRCYYACKFIKDDLFVKATTKNPHDRTASAVSAATASTSGSDDSPGEDTQARSNNDSMDPKHRRAYVQAESQLAYEAHLLGSLHHSNIVQLMGFFSTTTTTIPAKNNIPTTNALLERSVLLTELLDETLAQKLSRWRKSKRMEQDPGDATTKSTRTLEKLSICQQLADALEFLHSRNIAYRDLKPENVGFSGSTLKLFDFGLSREMILPEKDSGNSSPSPSQSSPLLLKGMIGTMRYMAPEVCLEESYDCDCDIYSYSILCWEVWTHKTPYAMLTPVSYRELVCSKGYRPPQVEVEIAKLQQQRAANDETAAATSNSNSACCAPIPKAMTDLMERGWVRDPKSRIRWPEIRHELSGIQKCFES